MARNFGFSSIYLKAGLALIVISLAMLITAFAAPAAAKYLSGRVAGYCLVAGAVLYAIGRVAQIWRSRARV